MTIPRTQPPGTYLYHPHADGSSGDQVAAGLDGVWIVEPDHRQIAASSEHVLVLRYRMPNILLNAFAPDETPIVLAEMAHEAARSIASPVPYDPFDPPPWPVSFPMNAVDGTDTPATLHVAAGTTQLLRILNATSDSATRLVMRDAKGQQVAFHVVGRDGVPVSGNMSHPLDRYVPMNELMLTAMSR